MSELNWLDVSQQDCQQLFASVFFSGCKTAELVKLSPTIKKQQVSKNTPIIQQGQDADFLYFILAGDVHSTIDKTGSNLTAGNFFGLAAAVGLVGYEANVLAQTDVTLLLIPREAFTLLIKHYIFVEERFYQAMIASYTNTKLTIKPEEPTQVNATLVDVVGWILTVSVPIFIFFLLDHAHAQWATRNFFTVFSSALVMLTFNLTKPFIPIVAIMVATTVMSIVPVEDIFSGFKSSVFYLVLSIFSLGAIITRSRLFYRLSLRLMRRLADRPGLVTTVCFGISAVMILIVPGSSARMTILALMLKDIVESGDFENNKPLTLKIIMASFYGGSLPAICIMTGSTSGLILYGLMPTEVREQISWFSWFVGSLSYMIFVTIFYSIVMYFLIRPKEKLKINKEKIDLQLGLLGKLTASEKVSIWALILLIVAVVISSFSSIYLSWLILAIFFILISLGYLSKEEFNHEIDWPFLFFLGGILSLSPIFTKLGVVDYLYKLSSQVHMLTSTPIIFLSIFFWLTSIASFLISGATLFIIALTLFLPVAQTMAISPWVVLFTLLAASSLWYLPYQNTAFLILSNADGISKYVPKNKFLLFNLGINIICYLALLLSIPYWYWLGLM